MILVYFVKSDEENGGAFSPSDILPYRLQVIATMEKYYPELIWHLYVIRPGKIFPIFFNLIKPFIQEDTRKKIEILGSMICSLLPV